MRTPEQCKQGVCRENQEPGGTVTHSTGFCNHISSQDGVGRESGQGLLVLHTHPHPRSISTSYFLIALLDVCRGKPRPKGEQGLVQGQTVLRMSWFQSCFSSFVFPVPLVIISSSHHSGPVHNLQDALQNENIATYTSLPVHTLLKILRWWLQSTNPLWLWGVSVWVQEAGPDPTQWLSAAQCCYSPFPPPDSTPPLHHPLGPSPCLPWEESLPRL